MTHSNWTFIEWNCIAKFIWHAAVWRFQCTCTAQRGAVMAAVIAEEFNWNEWSGCVLCVIDLRRFIFVCGNSYQSVPTHFGRSSDGEKDGATSTAMRTSILIEIKWDLIFNLGVPGIAGVRFAHKSNHLRRPRRPDRTNQTRSLAQQHIKYNVQTSRRQEGCVVAMAKSRFRLLWPNYFCVVQIDGQPLAAFWTSLLSEARPAEDLIEPINVLSAYEIFFLFWLNIVSVRLRC